MMIFLRKTLLVAILCLLAISGHADVDNKSLDDYLKKLNQGDYSPPATPDLYKKD